MRAPDLLALIINFQCLPCGVYPNPPCVENERTILSSLTAGNLFSAYSLVFIILALVCI